MSTEHTHRYLAATFMQTHGFNRSVTRTQVSSIKTRPCGTPGRQLARRRLYNMEGHWEQWESSGIRWNGETGPTPSDTLIA